MGGPPSENAIPALLPVTAIIQFKRDVVVIRGHPKTRPKNRYQKERDTSRGTIKKLSRRSRQRLAFVGWNTEVTFESMITLTYPAEYPSDGKRVKQHLRAFLEWMRRRWDNPSYLWFLEFQKRGAPHVHILMSARVVRADYKDVAAAWYRIVDSKDERHLRAGTRTEVLEYHDARYATAYASKLEQKRVPADYQNVGRWWGHSRDVAPREKGRLLTDEKTLRMMLEEWDYLPPPDKPLYRTLYGTSEHIAQYRKKLLALDVEAGVMVKCC